MSKDFTLMPGGAGGEAGVTAEVAAAVPVLEDDQWWEAEPQGGEHLKAGGGPRRVAVLTDFYTIDPAYSLTNVAGNQLKMLLRHGYVPRLLADVNLDESKLVSPWSQVPVFKLPSIPRSNRAELPKGWEGHLKAMTDAVREGLEDIQVVLTHDLIYQPAMILYNMAARTVANERPDLHWLHWIHSATPPRLINAQTAYLQAVGTRFPNAYVVFPNAYSRPRVARNFGYPEEAVKHVPHPIDIPAFLNMHPLAAELIEETGALNAEFVAVYPARLDRGKQIEFCIRIFAQLKKLGRTVRLVIADFHSTGGDKVMYRKEMERMGQSMGLSGEELVFLSQWREETRTASPRQLVANLMQISTVYIHPSRSETYSLTAQEAAICGAILVLNFDFPPMRDIYGNEPVFVKFGSNIDAMTGQDGDTNVQYNPDVDAYCRDVALRLIAELNNNSALKLKTRLRQTRNLDYVFREHVEPLLYSWG